MEKILSHPDSFQIDLPLWKLADSVSRGTGSRNIGKPPGRASGTVVVPSSTVDSAVTLGMTSHLCNERMDQPTSSVPLYSAVLQTNDSQVTFEGKPWKENLILF